MAKFTKVYRDAPLTQGEELLLNALKNKSVQDQIRVMGEIYAKAKGVSLFDLYSESCPMTGHFRVYYQKALVFEFTPVEVIYRDDKLINQLYRYF